MDGACREARFDLGKWFPLATGTLALKGALANFDYPVIREIIASTHTVFIGRVIAVRTNGRQPPLNLPGRKFRRAWRGEQFFSGSIAHRVGRRKLGQRCCYSVCGALNLRNSRRCGTPSRLAVARRYSTKAPDLPPSLEGTPAQLGGMARFLLKFVAGTAEERTPSMSEAWKSGSQNLSRRRTV